MSSSAGRVPPSEARVSLRPRPQAYRVYLLVALGAGALLALRTAFLEDVPWQWAAGLGLALAGLAAAGATLWYRTARVWSDRSALHRRTILGRVRSVPHADVASVVLAPAYRFPRWRASGLLAFLDRDGAGLLRLLGPHWGTGQLHALAGATGAPVHVREDALERTDLLVEHPGALPWLVRHERAFAGVVLVGVALVVTVLVLALRT